MCYFDHHGLVRLERKRHAIITLTSEPRALQVTVRSARLELDKGV